MKNEDRILELLVEALQRIDRHNERLDEHAVKFNQLMAELKHLRETSDKHSEEAMKQRQELLAQRLELKEQRELCFEMLRKIQQQDERSNNHSESIAVLRERTEYIHQSLLEQQQAYRSMTELLMFHNKALREKNIL